MEDEGEEEEEEERNSSNVIAASESFGLEFMSELKTRFLRYFMLFHA